MATHPIIRSIDRRFCATVFGAALALTGAGWLAAPARAAHSQVAMIQAVHDAGAPSDPEQVLAQARALGARTVRVIVPWASLAPSTTATVRPAFDAADPNAYSPGAWAPYDAVVRTAAQDGLSVDFTVSGPVPRWAEGHGIPGGSGVARLNDWMPSASAYGQFVRAVGARYDGHFTPDGAASPLPAVRFWAIFEEPNFGLHLAPQAVNGSRVLLAATTYRGLVDAGYRALSATGHRRDTILIGELNATGYRSPPTTSDPQGRPGRFGLTPPLAFLRAVYCLDTRYRALRGTPARHLGCPTTTLGSGRFRARNPGLFNASAIGDHPEPGNLSPAGVDRSAGPARTIASLGILLGALDRVTRAYGSDKRYDVYATEFGYITDARFSRRVVSPITAAAADNQAEYLSWKTPRVASFAQYLSDPAPGSDFAGFGNGLQTSSGQPKPAYDAYRLPLFLPRNSLTRGAGVELWGAARPAALIPRVGQGAPTVSIQLNGQTVAAVTVTDPGGYFDLRVRPAASGRLRLAYTYPSSEPFLPLGVAGSTVFSRSVGITVR